jgi:probable blue pigment (indigoidine) exporter
MPPSADVFATALAPAIWGSTYIVTTELLPDGYPLTVAMLRALPAGLLLLWWARSLPHGIWWLRSFLLGGLNFSVFWAMLFVSAYRLPGGVAATLGSIQTLIVIGLARLLLGAPVRGWSVAAALAGIGGVGLLVLTPDAALDPLGVAAGLIGALAMALGTVLSRRWQPPVPALTFASWQLTAGGLLLLPVAAWLEPPLPALSAANLGGLAYLAVIGGAFTYALWFRGLARLGPAAVAALGFLSPVTAVVLGWALLGQRLNAPQLAGMIIVIGSVWVVQRVQAMPVRTPANAAARTLT